MPFQPVFLWTDILVFILLAIVIGFVLIARRQPHLRAPWGRVLRSKVGMSTLVILGLYVLVGLLDTMHYRPQLDSVNRDGKAAYGPVQSVLDTVVVHLRESGEKTYSAPLSWQAYSKENVIHPDGRQERLRPRLRHGGAHLGKHPERDWAADVAKRVALGLAGGALCWLLLLALSSLRHPRSILSGLRPGDDVPWHVGWWTLLVMAMLIGVLVSLSSGYHVLGTDKVGEDVLYQSLKSVRTGLLIGTLTTLIMLPLAILLGVMAGYFRGWVDDVIQYIYTTLNSIPSVLLIAAAVLTIHVYLESGVGQGASLTERADLRLLALCVILGITSWTGLCRLLRGETFKLRELEYVQAAHAFGVGHFTVLVRHVVPNVLHLVLITVVLDFSGLVLAEAVLSYIKIGVDPSMNSWGNMINSARLELAREPVVWWSLAAAFFFMFALVLAANLLADVVRDAFDPHLKRAR